MTSVDNAFKSRLKSWLFDRVYW